MSVASSTTSIRYWYPNGRNRIGTYLPAASSTLTIGYTRVPDLPPIQTPPRVAADDVADESNWTLALSISLGSGNDAETWDEVWPLIAADSTLSDLVSTEQYSDEMAYRYDGTGATDYIDAEKAEIVDLTLINSSGVTFSSWKGLSIEDLRANARNSYESVLKLTGTAPKSWAWAYHDHDRMGMKILAEEGFLIARGFQQGGDDEEGDSNFLMESSDGNIGHEWDHFPMYELSVKFSSDDIDEFTLQAEMTAFLETTHDITQAKADNAVWCLYTHHTSELPTSVLDLLIDYLDADSDIWVCTLGELADQIRDTHDPGLDHNFWHPKDGESAADYSGAPYGPSRNKKMAFCFITDDGNVDNLNEYLPVFQDSRTNTPKFTAAVMHTVPGANVMTSSDVRELHDSGLCEIACHGAVGVDADGDWDSGLNTKMSCKHVAKFKFLGGRTKVAYKVEESDSIRYLKFYTNEDSLPEPDADPDGQLPCPEDWDQALISFTMWKILQRVRSKQRALYLDHKTDWLEAKRAVGNNRTQGMDIPGDRDSQQF